MQWEVRGHIHKAGQRRPSQARAASHTVGCGSQHISRHNLCAFTNLNGKTIRWNVDLTHLIFTVHDVQPCGGIRRGKFHSRGMVEIQVSSKRREESTVVVPSDLCTRGWSGVCWLSTLLATYPRVFRSTLVWGQRKIVEEPTFDLFRAC